MSLLDKLRNTFKGANRTTSKNKSKGSSSTTKTKKKEPKKDKANKSSTKSQNGSTTQNRGSQGVNRSESKVTTKATQPKNNTPSNTGWSDYVKKTLSSREAYRENVRKQAQQNANKNAPSKPKNAYEQRVAKQEAKDKKYYGMTRAGQLGATAEDKVKANKQSAVANTQLQKNHKFVAGVLDNVLPSAWDTTEFGDKNYYTDEQKKQIKKSQDSGAYKAGALVGTGIQFAAPAGAAKAVGKGAIKGGSKLAKGAKAVGLESAFNAPLNAVQAVKESKDENGKVDKKEFAKSLALNTALDVGIGGAAEGVGAAMAKKNAKKLIKLQTKANNGEVLTKDEKRELVRLYDDMEAKAKDKSNVSSETAENALKEANAETNLSKVTSGNKPAKDIKTVTREEAVASDKEAKIPETLTEREKKEFRYLRDKKETQKLTKRERNRLRELQNGGKANIKEASENALTLNEGRELARIKGREKAGTLSEADTIRMRQLEAKIEAKRNADNVMAESGEALQNNLDDLDNQIETVDNLATGKTEEMPTGTNEMPTQKVELPAEKAEQYKSVDVGTEHPSNMTDDEINAELHKIDIIRSRSRNKHGGLADSQRIRDTRADELREELNSRSAETATGGNGSGGGEPPRRTNEEGGVSTDAANNGGGSEPPNNGNPNTPTEREREGRIIATENRGSGGGGGRNGGNNALQADTNRVRDAWTSVRRLFEDSFIAIESSAKRVGGEAGQRLLAQVNNVRNAKNVAEHWITSNRVTFNRQNGGKALDDIFTQELRNDPERYSDFSEYLIMQHVPARHERGTDIFPDITPERAEARVRELREQYGEEIEEFAKDVHEYLESLQQYRVDTGLLTVEARDEFAQRYPFYVPTNRVGDESTAFFTNGSNLGNQIRTATGGEDAIMDMYQQMQSVTRRTIESGEENVMLKSYFESRGVSPECMRNAEIGDLEHATIDAQVNRRNNTASITFFNDGRPVRLNVDPQVAKGLREWNGQEFENLMRFARATTVLGKPFKTLITDWNVVFGIRNGARDMQQAAVNTKNLRAYTASIPSAAHAITHENNAFRRLYASMGGEYAQLVSYDNAGNMAGLDGVVGRIQRMQDGASNLPVIRQIEQINGTIEMLPRMSEFIGTLRSEVSRQHGIKLGDLKNQIREELSGTVNAEELADAVEEAFAERIVELAGKDAVERAMRNANDITLNFGRNGVIGKALNMGAVPYFNPSIQGLSKLCRQFTETGMEGGFTGLMNLGMKVGTITIAPAVFNEIMMKDNEDFQSLNTRDKDNNFFIPFGDDGKFIKIPKPRENAVLAEPVEYGLRYFFDKSEYALIDMGKLKSEGKLFDKIPLTEEGKQMFRTAMDNIGVVSPFESNLVSPLINTARNKTWFGGSIESAYETSIGEDGKPNVAVEDRYDITTSAIAIQLGQTSAAKFLNLSPKKIDNILDSYGGMIYDMGIAQTSDLNRTELSIKSNPIVNQFIKDSVFSNKLATKAWEKTDGMTKEELNQYKGTYMYDTYNYSDALTRFVSDEKGMSKVEKTEARRELKKKLNEFYKSAIDGKMPTQDVYVDIAETLKNHGVKNAVDKTLMNYTYGDEKHNYLKTAWEEYKGSDEYTKDKGKNSWKFLNTSRDIRDLNMVTGESKSFPQWTSVSLICEEKNRKGKQDFSAISEAYGVSESTTERVNQYLDAGYSTKNYKVTHKALVDGANDLGVYSSKLSDADKVMILSNARTKKGNRFRDGAYFIEDSSRGYLNSRMNAGRCLSSDKYADSEWTYNKTHEFIEGNNLSYNSSDEKIVDCIEKEYGDKTQEEKAALFYLIKGTGKKVVNPYGEIGDYSLDNDSGLGKKESGGGGRGRRGRRGRGGHGGGGSGSGANDDWYAYLKGLGIGESAASATTKVHDFTKPSKLDEAYRKRVRKLM